MVALTLAFSAQSYSHSLGTSEWDDNFKDAALFLPWPFNVRWKLLKAQAYQESRLNPMAVSPAGAKGVFQFMPTTWDEMKKKYQSVLGSIWLPEASISMGGRYMSSRVKFWNKSGRTPESRYKLGLAIYNSGGKYWLEAQRLCDGVMEYEQIAKCLPMVSGVKYQEPLDYVNKIWNKWRPMMESE